MKQKSWMINLTDQSQPSSEFWAGREEGDLNTSQQEHHKTPQLDGMWVKESLGRGALSILPGASQQVVLCAETAFKPDPKG